MKPLPSNRSFGQATLALWLLCFCACGPEPDGTPDDASAVPKAVNRPLFTKLAPEQTGVTSITRIDPEHPLSRLYVTGYAGGGVAIGDLDGDDRPDLFVTNGPGKNRLYIQVAPLQFEDRTEIANLDEGDAWGTGAALADLDNDGDLDIYVCNYDAPAQLYINDGDAHFSEQAARYGLDQVSALMTPAFSDFDRDGFLDVYLLANRYIREEGLPQEQLFEYRNGVPHILPKFEKYFALTDRGSTYSVDSIGQPDRLLRHNGSAEQPGYIDVSASAGIESRGMGLSVRWWDYNDDGYPDLYVANDFDSPDKFWRNNGNGTFSPVLAESMPHTTWFSMGSDTGDINNDGYPDLLVADMAGSTHFKEKLAMGTMNLERFSLVEGPPPQIMRNSLLLGTGTPRFLEAGHLSGLAKTDWTWSVKLADLDNDGWLDAFFTNGSTRDYMDPDHLAASSSNAGKTEWQAFANAEERKENNLAFRNLGDLQFKEVSEPWGLDHYGMSYAAAHSDLDRDGDLDLVVINLNEPIAIYRNEQVGGNSVQIKLRGTLSNSQGLGARIRIATEKGSYVRQVRNSSGFNSGDEAIVHFGLGSAEKVSSLRIDWPSGCSQERKNIAINQLHTITEPKETGTELTWKPLDRGEAQALFREDRRFEFLQHREGNYDDFKTQPLLPNKLSQLGPPLAWGDVDGDGYPELYYGGAANQAATLCRQGPDGAFAKLAVEAFDRDAAFEDMGAVFLDVDQDGDLDLYVASGSVEVEEGSALLHDRLYLNTGKGAFRRAPATCLPKVNSSGGALAAADFDRDGDLDLLVGGRSVPAKYPISPRSFLLQNRTPPGGEPRFEDSTDELAQGLARCGMVTSALWTDIDADGWLDLLLAREWDSLQIWKNESGRFRELGEASGLAEHRGWWNAVTGGDFDGDGDIDYVASNAGLNTKYKASREHPIKLYYGSFAGEKNRIIEAKYEDDTLYPVRGLGCSKDAMPGLQAQFGSYREFALAPLEEIYPSETLQSAEEYLCNTLETGVFVNSGKGEFRFSPLPRLAQISPSFGILAAEMNGDGHTDIYLAQNFFHPQVETGRMAGGLSLLLAGRGDGTFAPVWPRESGLLVSGDAKSATTADLNDDAMIDVVVGINDSRPVAFVNQSPDKEKFISVRLAGPRGNPQGVGSRITLVRKDGHVQTAEVYAGSGYLSQSSGEVFFGLGPETGSYEIRVRWPDGSSQVAAPRAGRRQVIEFQGQPSGPVPLPD